VPIEGQQFGALELQSALSRQIGDWQEVAHAMVPPLPPLPSQHGIPLQSSTPSQVAAMPAHVAVSATHDGPPMKSLQHFWFAAHVVVPHSTPADETGASVMLLPLPAPPQTPLMQAWPSGHVCCASHLKCVPL
jgi:hypothetical protein